MLLFCRAGMTLKTAIKVNYLPVKKYGMRKLLLLLLFLNFVASAQYKNGSELLKAMHDKHSGKYCQTVQFDQKTVRYDNQSAKDTSYWYEWISYPDKFRIDFGKKY